MKENVMPASEPQVYIGAGIGAALKQTYVFMLN
jgi:hypothetical protein